MEAKKKRLTLLLEPEAQRRLRDAAARQGVSVQDLCRSAIDDALDKFARDAGSAATPHFDIEGLIALQKQTFGDRVLPTDSAEIIREQRELRTGQLPVGDSALPMVIYRPVDTRRERNGNPE